MANRRTEKKSPKRTKPRKVNFWTTDAVRAEIRTRAKQAGMELGEFIEAAALGATIEQKALRTATFESRVNDHAIAALIQLNGTIGKLNGQLKHLFTIAPAAARAHQSEINEAFDLTVAAQREVRATLGRLIEGAGKRL